MENRKQKIELLTELLEQEGYSPQELLETLDFNRGESLQVNLACALVMREFLKDGASVRSVFDELLSLAQKLTWENDSVEDQIQILMAYIHCGIETYLNNYQTYQIEFSNTIFNRVVNIERLLLSDRKSPYTHQFYNIIDNIVVQEKYNIAYGSNMNKKQMAQRSPNSEIVAVSYLQDYQLTLPFYADIMPLKGAKTPIVIWNLTHQDEVVLDEYEGFPNEYDKQYIIVEVDNRKYSALVYIMTQAYKYSQSLPREFYEEGIIEGYIENGFDASEYQPWRSGY